MEEAREDQAGPPPTRGVRNRRKRGSGSIFYRADGRFEARTPETSGERRSFYGHSEACAEEALDAYLRPGPFVITCPRCKAKPRSLERFIGYTVPPMPTAPR